MGKLSQNGAESARYIGPAPSLQQRAEAERTARALARCEKETRASVIRECVTWLALHAQDIKPEFLPGAMAREVGKGEV